MSSKRRPVASRIAANLSRLRNQHDMTHEELGQHLGVTLWTSMRWCSGRSTPSIEQLQKLASMFKVSVADLIGESRAPA
jgi:DNA-binding XRE family transcriptional regulator